MDDAQVSDVELVSLLDYHELAFPELLVVSDLVMVVVSLSDLELR
jgi:hypothetical protein